MKFKASQIGKLMTASRSKDPLSEGARTEIMLLAKKHYYGYSSELNDRKVKKGIVQEQDSIDLLNMVRIEDYQKNNLRLDNEFLTGECDIISDGIIDIKTSWDLNSFPATILEAQKKTSANLYEWQLTAYMCLYDKPYAELIYCMVDTDPLDVFGLLNDWDNLSLHRVSDIAHSKRITVLRYERDLDKEWKMMEHLKLCSEFYDLCINELEKK
jgi:hypothetical protein